MRKQIIFLKLSVILIIVFGILFNSCEDEPIMVATSLELVEGNAQTATVETILANQVELIVKDQEGNAFKGATVKFEIAEGSVSSATATTSTDGKVSVAWTLGSTVGEQTMTVTAYKVDGTTVIIGSPLTVRATGEAILRVATSIELVSGGNQTAKAGTELSNPIEVLVKDQNGDVYPDARVNFEVAEGSVSSATQTTSTVSIITDENGKATTIWTLGSTVGEQTLTVTAYKVDGTTALAGSPLTVKANGEEIPLVATSIELVSGINQSQIIETELTDPIEVLVKDQNGNAIAGVTVNFEVAEGSVSSATAATDESGKASVIWTLGSTAGDQTLVITAFETDGTTALTGSPINISAEATIPSLQLNSFEVIDAYTIKLKFSNSLVTSSASFELYQLTRQLTVSSVDFENQDKDITINLFCSLGADNHNYNLTSTIEDIYGNSLSIDETFDGKNPVGIANFGDDDNFVIKGVVTDNSNNLVSGFVIPIYNRGADNEYSTDDDISIQVMSDNNGYYEIRGLPNTAGVNISDEGNYEINVYFNDIYEPYYNFYINALGNSTIEYNIDLYKLVSGTVLEGYIKGSSGNPFSNTSGSDLVQIRRSDRDIWTHSLENDNPSASCYYDTQTGYYKFSNIFAGGDYWLNIGEPGYIGVSDILIHIEPGQTTTKDFTLTPE